MRNKALPGISALKQRDNGYTPPVSKPTPPPKENKEDTPKPEKQYGTPGNIPG